MQLSFIQSKHVVTDTDEQVINAGITESSPLITARLGKVRLGSAALGPARLGSARQRSARSRYQCGTARRVIEPPL